MGDIGLEPTTSTMSTSKGMDECPVNHGAKSDDAESLHQCLHQIGWLVESGGPDLLADALAELLEGDVFERLAVAISRRVEKR